MWSLFMPPKGLTMPTSRSSISKNIILTGQIIERQRDRQTRETNVSSAVSHSMDSKRKPSSNSVPPEGSSSLPYTSPKTSCAACGQAGVRLREVTRSFGRGPRLLVIEGVPMWPCPHCGELYFTGQTMHEIERIKTLRKSVAAARHVPVAIFTGDVPDKALHRTRQKRPAGKRDR